MSTSTEQAGEKLPIEALRDNSEFLSWLDKVGGDEAKDIGFTEENRPAVERFHGAWERSKTLAEKAALVYKTRLAALHVGTVKPDEVFELQALLGQEALTQPEQFEKRERDYEQLEKLPQQIKEAEAKLSVLAGKVAGIDDLAKKLDAAKEEQKLLKEITKDLPKSVQLSFMDKTARFFEKFNFFVSFDEKIKRAEKAGDKEYVERLRRIQGFEKAEASRAKLETEYSAKYGALPSGGSFFNERFAELDASIKTMALELMNKKYSKNVFDSLSGKVKEMKETAESSARKLCSELPIHATIHRRIGNSVLALIRKAMDSTDFGSITEAVNTVRRLEAVGQKEGRSANFLALVGLNPDTGARDFSLDTVKGYLDAQLEEAVKIALVEAIAATLPGTTAGIFYDSLSQFTDMAVKGFGFKNSAESKAFILSTLEGQKAAAAAAGNNDRAKLLSVALAKLRYAR